MPHADAPPPYRRLDVLRCPDCGHTFLNRARDGARVACRRCGKDNVAKWRAGG